MKAMAGEWAYTFEVFRDEMARASKEFPHSEIRCVSPRNGISFCGLVPAESDGSVIEIVPIENSFLTKPRKVVHG